MAAFPRFGRHFSPAQKKFNKALRRRGRGGPRANSVPAVAIHTDSIIITPHA
jgi:hypothetical protein